DPFDRGVRAMRRAERVVDVEIRERRELRRELRIVLLFFGMKAQVLEQHDAGAGGVRLIDRLLHLVADAVAGKDDRTPEQPAGPPPGGGSCADAAGLWAGRDGWRRRRSRRASTRTGSSAAPPGCACRRRSRRS